MLGAILLDLQKLESRINRLEKRISSDCVYLGVRGQSNAVDDHDALLIELKAIDFSNRQNYEKRIKTALKRFRGQLNYAYLYDKVHLDTDWAVMDKYYFDSILVDFMADAVIDKIKTWHHRSSAVPVRLVKALEEFMHTYCNCRSPTMMESLNNIVTRWFQEMPNDNTKPFLVTAYLTAFNDAFEISMYYKD